MNSSQGVPAAGSRNGRGARQRILDAAAKLFYEEGIVTTGVERLAEAAHVSKRTLYDHFPGKALIVDEYLRQFEEIGVEGERVLDQMQMGPRERLMAMFADLPDDDAPLRGCPFHNASVEAAGTMPTVREAVLRHKNEFLAKLATTAEEAGALNPEALARQLAVLFEGSRALGTSLNAPSPLADARAAAEVLIGAAMSSTPAGHATLSLDR